MRTRLPLILVLTAMLLGMRLVPALAYADCGIVGNFDKSPWVLSQRVALNNEGTVNTRGLQTVLDVRSPYLHPNMFMGVPNASSLPSWVRQAVRVQTSSTTFIEYGWEYWWQLATLPSGYHWQRRAYYRYSNNGNDYTAHYLGSIGTGPHRFYLYNRPSAPYPNKWVLQTKNVNTGAFATHKVLDPPYDAANAYALVAATDSCNEMTMTTSDSWRLSPTNLAWYHVSTVYNAGWWYGEGGDLSNPATHWICCGWWGNMEEFYTYCYKNGGTGCTS